MIFYYKCKSYINGEFECWSGEYYSRESFLKALAIARTRDPYYCFLEVPYSCVNRLFGSVGWIGIKPWPKDQ